MLIKRKAIGKKTRFEVFKRDGFKCQYCGAHPPESILEIDHINPVALGGGNEMDNLITACFSCNRGKSANSLDSVPQTLADKAKMIKETEAQLRGYQQIMDARHERIESELWRVSEMLEDGSSEAGIPRDFAMSIRKFNAKLGVHECITAAQIARTKYPRGGQKTFRYFFGICWNLVREMEAQ